MIQELIKSRELVWNLVKRDLKVRYKSSVLGFFWSFGKPLLHMLILWFVFTTVLRLPQFRERNPRMPFALHLLTGVLAWSFFAGGLTDAMHSIYVNANLVKKVKLNPAVFPVASVLSNLVNYLFALVVLFGFMLVYRVPLTLHIFFIAPVIVIQAFFMLTLSLLLSALFVFYRDVGSILEVVLTAWFYATPIIYPFWLAEAEIPKRFASWIYDIYLLNPMTPLVVAYRQALFRPLLIPSEMSDIRLTYYLFYTLILSGIFYVIFKWVFERFAVRFADEL